MQTGPGMELRLQDFAREYAAMQDDQLLRLASTPEDLVSEARSALDSEMGRRGLKTSARLQAFHNEETQRAREIDLDSIRKTRVLFPRGFGQTRFCKGDYLYHPESGFEEFRTTFFFLLFYLPLIPMGTYRVQRRKGSGRDFTEAEKLPLSWYQVLQVWATMMLALLLLLAVVRFLPRAL